MEKQEEHTFSWIHTIDDETFPEIHWSSDGNNFKNENAWKKRQEWTK